MKSRRSEVKKVGRSEAENMRDQKSEDRNPREERGKLQSGSGAPFELKGEKGKDGRIE